MILTFWIHIDVTLNLTQGQDHKVKGHGQTYNIRKNKIAQGDVNIFSQLTFFLMFDIFCPVDRK